MTKQKRIAVVGGGPFGILSALRLSQNPANHVSIFESSRRLGGLSASEPYKNQYLDYSTKFVPCNQFGRPGIPEALEKMLDEEGVLLDDIGRYHFLDNGKEQLLPPVLKGYSKPRLLKEAMTLFKYFPKADAYTSFTELEQIPGFERNKSFEELASTLGFESFARLVEYFSMIFGNSTRGGEGLSVVTSRNAYNTYNYLSGIFVQTKGFSALASLVDKEELLDRSRAVPYTFLMPTTGYDRFLQSLVRCRSNIDIYCDETIVDIDKDRHQNSQTYRVINADAGSHSNFDEVVLALPMRHIQKMKFSYVRDLVKDINTSAANYVLSCFANIDSPQIKYLAKGIYLDYRNPHGVGTTGAKKEGSLYGMFKHFNADSMCQSLSMVNDVDLNSIDESFVHAKWVRCMKEFDFDITAKDVKPYAWKILRWNNNFAQVGDFAYFESLHRAQGKEGIWFGGEIMCGPGVPVILKYVESLFGAFDINRLSREKLATPKTRYSKSAGYLTASS